MLADIWNNLLFYPILNILVALYHLFGNNLGWAVIVLAIFTRLILIPSTKKQMDMTKKMAALKPAMEDLNKKYANNKELLAKEQIKLYKEYGYNPLGCFFNFISQLVILLVIVQVIRVVTGNNYAGLYPFVQTWVSNGGTFAIDTHFYFWDLAKNFSAISKDSGIFAIEGIAYMVLAILVGVVQYFSSRFMQDMQGMKPSTKKKNSDPSEPLSADEMQLQMSKSMNTIFPIITAFSTLTVPAVLGFYWITQSFMFIAQYFLIDKGKALETLKGYFKKKS